MTTTTQVPELEAGKDWLRVRLQSRVHPLDHLEPDAAARTIDSLTGLDPRIVDPGMGRAR